MHPVLLRSDFLPVPHAFTTRVGGVSQGIFESLNLGNPSDLPPERRDPPANIGRNIAGIVEALGCTGREVVQVHQVHGATAHTVRHGWPAHADPRDTKADALATDDPIRILCVRTADCAPVLLASMDGRVVAAVHAGWRGVIAGVAPAAVRAMRALGARDVAAAIGPCISVDHFEVGPEVMIEFDRVFGPDPAILRRGPGERGRIDLKAALARQLRHEGVDAVDILPHCTHRDADLFFSHRRDRGVTGRIGAFISPR